MLSIHNLPKIINSFFDRRGKCGRFGTVTVDSTTSMERTLAYKRFVKSR